MRSWWMVKRRGPSGVWYWPSAAAVSMKMSCTSAPVVVKVQAMRPLWPEHQERHAGGGRTGQRALGGVDAGEVPDAGKAERKVRVAREQGGAGGGVAAVDRPLVRGGAGQRVGIGEARQDLRQGAGDFGLGVPDRGSQRPGGRRQGAAGHRSSITCCGKRPASDWRDSSVR